MTKVAVTEKHLIDLLAKNKTLAIELLRQAASGRLGRTVEVRPSKYNQGISLVIGLTEFTIIDGKVTWDGYSNKDALPLIEALVPELADALFDREIGAILAQNAIIQDHQALSVHWQDRVVEASLYTCTAGPYKIRVFCLPGGQLELIVDNGTFENARTVSEALFATLEVSGIEASMIGQTETHVDSQHAHVVSNQQLHLH